MSARQGRWLRKRTCEAAVGRSDLLQAVSAGLAAALVSNDFVRNLVAFVQGAETSPLDGADVHENVSSTLVRLDEPETFLTVKPLHCTGSHRISNRLSRQLPATPYSTENRIFTNGAGNIYFSSAEKSFLLSSLSSSTG